MDKRFTTIPIYRGVAEIAALIDLVADYGGQILGGYVRYMASPGFNPELPSDVDVFAESEEYYPDLEKALTKALSVAHESPIAISFNRKTEGPFAYGPKVQLIKPRMSDRIRTYGPMEEILSFFDFSIVRIGLINDKEALADVDFLEHENRRRLVVKNVTCAVSNLARAMKYSKKGYFMPIVSIMTLLDNWLEVTDEYRASLTDLISLRDLGEATESEIEQLENLMLID